MWYPSIGTPCKATRLEGNRFAHPLETSRACRSQGVVCSAYSPGLKFQFHFIPLTDRNSCLLSVTPTPETLALSPRYGGWPAKQLWSFSGNSETVPTPPPPLTRLMPEGAGQAPALVIRSPCLPSLVSAAVPESQPVRRQARLCVDPSHE